MVAPDLGVLVAPGDPKLVQLIPHARPLPTGHLVIPHEPVETRILRNVGFNVPSPILHGYDWCEQPSFEAQRITAAMLVVEPRAFVLNEMGTGKTRSVIFAYDWLRRRKLVKRMLVVAPLSTLNFTWARELFNTAPGYRVAVVHGSRERREKILQNKAIDVFIINHDGVGTVLDTLKTMDIDILCLDEAATYRKANTKKWKQLNTLVPRFKYVWALTGTPTPREPIDAYGIIKLVNPSAYPHSYSHFRDKLMLRVTNFKWVPRKGAEQDVATIMQPAVRFRMADCMDMPQVTFTNHEVGLTTKQKHVYEGLRKHCRMLLESGQVTAVNGGVLLNKLLQVSSGVVYDDKHAPIIIDDTHRPQALLELVEANDRKSIIFVPFIPLVNLVGDYLEKHGCTVHRVSGATPKADRDKIFNRFQSDPVKAYTSECIVAHPKTMAHGLTLTAANMIVWYAPISDLEIYEQANARIVRPGQTSNQVSIRHLTGSKSEELVYKRLSMRQSTQTALLELFEDD